MSRLYNPSPSCCCVGGGPPISCSCCPETGIPTNLYAEFLSATLPSGSGTNEVCDCLVGTIFPFNYRSVGQVAPRLAWSASLTESDYTIIPGCGEIPNPGGGPSRCKFFLEFDCGGTWSIVCNSLAAIRFGLEFEGRNCAGIHCLTGISGDCDGILSCSPFILVKSMTLSGMLPEDCCCPSGTTFTVCISEIPGMCSASGSGG